MPDRPEDPYLIVRLGLSIEEDPPLKVLLRRAIARLSVVHSGQKKLDWMVSRRFLGEARLQVEDNQFVLRAKIPPSLQGDLIGYPDASGHASACPSHGSNAASSKDTGGAGASGPIDPSACIDVVADDAGLAEVGPLGHAITDALDFFLEDMGSAYGAAANDDPEPGVAAAISGSDGALRGVAASDAGPRADDAEHRRSDGGASGDGAPLDDASDRSADDANVMSGGRKAPPMLRLEAALDYLASDLEPLAERACRAGLSEATDSPRQGACARAAEGLRGENVPNGEPSGDLPGRTVERVDPADPEQLPVAETLEGVRRSASFMHEVKLVMQASRDIVRDTKILEEASGLKSAAARRFIASRQPGFEVRVDGMPVTFAAEPVRTSVTEDAEIAAVLRLCAPRGHFDEFKVRVISTEGVGVPNGIATLGRHEIRFADLLDVQRGILFILRGAAHVFNFRLKEAISTQTLKMHLPLVVDAGDWGSLTEAAIEILQNWRKPNGTGGRGYSPGLVRGEVGDLFVAGNPDDDLEAA